MATTECIECPQCSEYYCSFCEDPNFCEGCGQSFCEDCSNFFDECGGCKKKFCEECTTGFDICDTTEECSYTACDDCMDKHETDHLVDDKHEV